MQRIPIVWVPKDPLNVDIRPAESWGQVVRVFGPDTRPYDVIEQARAFDEAVSKAARREDYVLIVGPRGSLCAFVAMWVAQFGSVNMLLWSARAQNYIMKTVPANSDGN